MTHDQSGTTNEPPTMDPEPPHNATSRGHDQTADVVGGGVAGHGVAGAAVGGYSAATVAGFGSVLFAGAIFGFFYAWSSSAMIGFDAADPRIAIEAMQEVNAAVRNAIFFPAFFLTPVVAAIAGVLHWRRDRRAASWFLAGAVVYVLGGIGITAGIHIPLNNDLAGTAIPADLAAAQAVWDDYSGQWQFWNAVRAGFSGLALLLCTVGVRAGRRV